jgi:hypothetical protein
MHGLDSKHVEHTDHQALSGRVDESTALDPGRRIAGTLSGWAWMRRVTAGALQHMEFKERSQLWLVAPLLRPWHIIA